MSFFDGICINTILIMFPLLIYLLYFVYKSKIINKKQNMIFNIALISSVLLTIIYGRTNDLYTSIILNIPLLFSYLKDTKYTSILITFLLICHYAFVLKLDLIIAVFEYLTYYLLIVGCKKKSLTANKIIYLFILIKTFFISFYTFLYINPSGDIIINLKNISLSIIILYIISKFYYMTVQKTEDILELNNLTMELEKEKSIRNSIFRIAHEIKNPIAVCKGYLDMSSSKKIEKYLPTIKSEINRTLTIMDDILSCTKIKLSKDILDLNLLIEESYQVTSFLNRDESTIINLECSNDEIYFMGDYDRLKQVLINLVKNSLEAKDNTRNLIINIIGKYENGYYQIIVEDNGVGIRKEDLEKMGEMFFTTKISGTGIGVNLSMEIIEKHQGTLTYESKEYVGTRAIITLPIDKYLNNF